MKKITADKSEMFGIATITGACAAAYAGLYDVNAMFNHFLEVHNNISASLSTAFGMSEDARNMMMQAGFKSFFFYALEIGVLILIGVLVLRYLGGGDGLYCTGMLLRAMAAATLTLSGAHFAFCKFLIFAGDILISTLPAVIVLVLIETWRRNS